MSLHITDPDKPVLVVLDDIDASDAVMDYLSVHGAFVGSTTAAPAPISKHIDEWVARRGTSPTYAVVTCGKCDDRADGLTVYFCDESALARLRSRFGDMEEVMASGLSRFCR